MIDQLSTGEAIAGIGLFLGLVAGACKAVQHFDAEHSRAMDRRQALRAAFAELVSDLERSLRSTLEKYGSQYVPSGERVRGALPELQMQEYCLVPREGLEGVLRKVAPMFLKHCMAKETARVLCRGYRLLWWISLVFLVTLAVFAVCVLCELLLGLVYPKVVVALWGFEGVAFVLGFVVYVRVKVRQHGLQEVLAGDG